MPPLTADVAENFKNQGNDYYRGKRYREALKFYHQALGASPQELSLKESLFLNIAACELELSTCLALTQKTTVALCMRPGALWS